MNLTDYYNHFGIDDKIIRDVMSEALSHGGDYCDLYFQHGINNYIGLEDKAVNKAYSNVDRLATESVRRTLALFDAVKPNGGQMEVVLAAGSSGILLHYYIDDYYGKKLGMEPTTGSFSNLVFEYGSRSLEEMIRDMKKGILVTGFIGGNSNSTTGDFSFGIVGQLIEDGEIIKPINEMNISGNEKDFWNQLIEMGNDPYPYSSTRRPSMVFEGVNFSGI